MVEKENDTEIKIKEAARKIFREKGFAATKTREIAEAADINLALLNYYFRSKQKLFDLIMMETIHDFFNGLSDILDHPDTPLLEKVSAFVDQYIDLLSTDPHIPSFILNEVRSNPEEFMAKIGVLDKLMGSVFMRQFMQGVQEGEIPAINPIHFMMNLAGLIVFPFIASPMIMTATGMEQNQWAELMKERKKLIPQWVESMLVVTE